MTPEPTPSSAAGTALEGEGLRAAAASLRMVLLSDAIPGRNGVGTYYDDLAQHLRDHLDVLYLATPPRDREAPYRGVRLPLPGDGTQELFLPWPRKLWRELTEVRPHVVLSATPSAYGLLGMALAHRSGAGFCVGHHTQLGELAGFYWTSLMGRVSRAALGLWDHLVLRSGATVLVHNQDLVEEMRTRGVRDVQLVGTPTAKAFLDRPPSPHPTAVRRVAFVGRLAPEKRVDQVLEAAEAIPDLSFRVVGDGPERPRVDAAAARLPNVEAVPWVDRARVLDILDDTDLLVLPSIYETFGTAALEAMARGRVALVSDRCGIGLWPGLADGLLRMEPDEHLIPALGRVRAMSPEALRSLGETARAAARRLADRTVEHWLAVLTALAPRDARP